MKKIFAGLMASALMLGTLAGCDALNNNGGGGSAADAKTGLAVMASNSDRDQKAPEADKDGQIQLQTYVAAALVGEDDKVIELKVDVIQSPFAYNADGITTEPNTEFKSKKQLGPDYNMKGASAADGIGKEWDEQAAAFEEWAKGKTAAEIRGVAVDEGGVPTDEDLSAGVTITVTSLAEIAARAVENAEADGAKSTDSLGLGVVSNANQTSSEQATQYSTFVAATFDGDNKVTSSILDASQARAKLEDGAVTTDLKAELKTKRDLGNDYNMKGTSAEVGIGKEWFEQADGFEEYAKGKTAAEIKATPVDDEGTITDTDLAASVSITATDIILAYERAGEVSE